MDNEETITTYNNLILKISKLQKYMTDNANSIPAVEFNSIADDLGMLVDKIYRMRDIIEEDNIHFNNSFIGSNVIFKNGGKKWII